MSLLQPWYLWALAGLAVPLAIHLLSRKEGPVIRMGSLRHIREASSRQFRSIKLNEYLLLLLRSVVISLIVLLMSGWYLDHLKDNRKWLIVENGLENASSLFPLFDSLYAVDYEKRFLLPGFPKMDKATRPRTTPDYAARLEELGREGIYSAVIIASNRVTGFTGKRVSLPDNVKWMPFYPGPGGAEVSRVTLRGDSVFIRESHSNELETSFSNYRLLKPAEQGLKARERDTIRIVLASDEGYAQERQIILASLEAIRKEVPDIIAVTSISSSVVSDPGTIDWLFWLSKSAAPKGTNILYMSERNGGPLLEEERPCVVALTSRLNSEVAVTQHLAAQLMRMLFPSREAWKIAKTTDARSVDDKMLWSKATVGKDAVVVERGNQASTNYLLMVLFVFIVLERIVSYKRNQ